MDTGGSPGKRLAISGRLRIVLDLLDVCIHSQASSSTPENQSTGLVFGNLLREMARRTAGSCFTARRTFEDRLRRRMRLSLTLPTTFAEPFGPNDDVRPVSLILPVNRRVSAHA